MLEMRGGDTITIATPEAVAGDDLQRLEAEVLASYRRRLAEEEAAHRSPSPPPRRDPTDRPLPAAGTGNRHAAPARDQLRRFRAVMPQHSNERRKETEPLEQAVRIRRERQMRGQKEGTRSIGQNLALIGVLGWSIVTPMLIGIFVGRWLDRAFTTGIFWTLGLLVAGLAIGCTLAWQRINRP